jgi:hypothetical protein
VNIPRTEPTLEQRIIGVMRFRHYSRQTELGYMGWSKRYVLFHKEVCGQMRHPKEMGAPEVEAFLTHLAVNRSVSASAQRFGLRQPCCRFAEPALLAPESLGDLQSDGHRAARQRCGDAPPWALRRQQGCLEKAAAGLHAVQGATRAMHHLARLASA